MNLSGLSLKEFKELVHGMVDNRLRELLGDVHLIGTPGELYRGQAARKKS